MWNKKYIFFNIKDNIDNISDLNESEQNNNNNDILIRDINDLNNKYELINFKLSCSFDSFISIFIFSINPIIKGIIKNESIWIMLLVKKINLI